MLLSAVFNSITLEKTIFRAQPQNADGAYNAPPQPLLLLLCFRYRLQYIFVPYSVPLNEAPTQNIHIGILVGKITFLCLDFIGVFFGYLLACHKKFCSFNALNTSEFWLH